MAMIEENLGYIDTPGKPVAAWTHRPANNPLAGCHVLLCNPLGTEYMSGYRSIRYLASHLAKAGITSHRFDYRVAGDSGGGNFASASLGDFVDDITSVVRSVRKTERPTSLLLVGVGLGATFAALAADVCELDGLVLWNPTTNGRRFVREQKLLSELLNQEYGIEDDAIDAAGVYLVEPLLTEFKEIDLRSCELDNWPPTLLIEREDLALDERFLSLAMDQVPNITHANSHDYAQMMANPTDTQIPTDTFSKVTDWISDLCGNAGELGHNGQTLIRTTSLSLEHGAEEGVWFGESERLFGILASPDRPATHAFIFLNCGSEHHAGPHRIYTRISRILVGKGVSTLRFDIEGIGDSPASGANDDNNSYSPVALRDIRSALKYMSETHGTETFTLIGICAGAYHSFISAAGIEEYEIRQAVLINPLVFEWNYEKPGEHFRYEMHTYSKSMKDKSRWTRLLRGQVDLRRLGRALLKTLGQRLKKIAERSRLTLGIGEEVGAAGSMNSIIAQNRQLKLLLAENDPGLNLLQLLAPSQTKKMLSSGQLEVYDLPATNHGFSKYCMQDKLIKVVNDVVSSSEASH